MFLAILGGVLLAISLAQVAVLVMSFLYKDDNSWLMVPSAGTMIIGLGIQGLMTGVWSAALISVIPQAIFLTVVFFGGTIVYETVNPFKIYSEITKESWAVSKLANRLKTLVSDTIAHIKETYWRGYYAALGN